MGDKTGIEWTDRTWNPVVGCNKVSPGCKNCYAKTLHDQRHKAFHEGKKIPLQYAKPFEEVQLMPDRLTHPLSWSKPQRVFVNSVSDLFHDDVPDGLICDVFKVMGRASRHTFQVLTKRPERMQRFMREQTNAHAVRMVDEPGFHVVWPYPNVWLGVSVEDQQRADERIPLLLQTPAAVRFLSCEPLLESVKLSLLGLDTGNPAQCVCGHGHGFTRCPNYGGISAACHVKGCDCRQFARRPDSWHGVDWVIVGGESGNGARPFNPSWAKEIVGQCNKAGVACFVKQLGGNVLSFAGSLRDKKGGDMSEWPEDLQVREFPNEATKAKGRK